MPRPFGQPAQLGKSESIPLQVQPIKDVAEEVPEAPVRRSPPGPDMHAVYDAEVDPMTESTRRDDETPAQVQEIQNQEELAAAEAAAAEEPGEEPGEEESEEVEFEDEESEESESETSEASEAEPELREIYESMTVPELKEECREAGLEGYSTLNKPELVELLLADAEESE